MPDVPPLGLRNPGGNAFTFLRDLCYHAVHERIQIQEQKLWRRFGEDALRGAGLLKRSQTKTDAFRCGLLAVSSSVVLTERL